MTMYMGDSAITLGKTGFQSRLTRAFLSAQVVKITTQLRVCAMDWVTRQSVVPRTSSWP